MFSIEENINRYVVSERCPKYTKQATITYYLESEAGDHYSFQEKHHKSLGSSLSKSGSDAESY